RRARCGSPAPSAPPSRRPPWAAPPPRRAPSPMTRASRCSRTRPSCPTREARARRSRAPRTAASPAAAGATGTTAPPAPTGRGAEMAVDKPRIEAAVREILAAIGEDPDRDGLLDTPSRVARMYDEVFEGLAQDAREPLSTTF